MRENIITEDTMTQRTVHRLAQAVAIVAFDTQQLSIAKSLTELQGGKFQLYLDGDLFKVTITFQAQNSKCTDAEVPAQPKPEAR